MYGTRAWGYGGRGLNPGPSASEDAWSGKLALRGFNLKIRITQLPEPRNVEGSVIC